MLKRMNYSKICLIALTMLLSVSVYSKEFNACEYGAKPDGKTVCTQAIQKTIDTCAKEGGGTVVFSEGTISWVPFS